MGTNSFGGGGVGSGGNNGSSTTSFSSGDNMRVLGIGIESVSIDKGVIRIKHTAVEDNWD